MSPSLSQGACATLRRVSDLARRARPPAAYRPLARMTLGRTLRLVLAALTIALIVWLFAGAADEPDPAARGYEVLTAHCEARAPESCTTVHVTGDGGNPRSPRSGPTSSRDWNDEGPRDGLSRAAPPLRAKAGCVGRSGSRLK